MDFQRSGHCDLGRRERTSGLRERMYDRGICQDGVLGERNVLWGINEVQFWRRGLTLEEVV